MRSFCAALFGVLTSSSFTSFTINLFISYRFNGKKRDVNISVMWPWCDWHTVWGQRIYIHWLQHWWEALNSSKTSRRIFRTLSRLTMLTLSWRNGGNVSVIREGTRRQGGWSPYYKAPRSTNISSVWFVNFVFHFCPKYCADLFKCRMYHL